MLGWLKRLLGRKKSRKNKISLQQTSRGAVSDPGLSTSSDFHSVGQQSSHRSSDGFNESLAVGYMTNDALMGGIVGGNLIGGMIGDLLRDSEEHLNKPEVHHHHLDDAEVGPADDFDSIGGSHSSNDFESSGSDGSSFDGGDCGSSE